VFGNVQITVLKTVQDVYPLIQFLNVNDIGKIITLTELSYF